MSYSRDCERHSQSHIERYNIRHLQTSSSTYTRPRAVAPLRTAITVIQAVPFQRTSELQSSGATPGEIITYVLAWQQLPIRTRADYIINHRVATAVEGELLAVL